MKYSFRWLLLLLLCVLVLTALVLTGCDSGDDSTTHTHSFGEWSVTTPATCVAKGEETRSCACGASEKRDVAIDPTAHNPATAWTYDGTHHWHDCTHCGHDLDRATHDYDFENYCNDCRYYQEIGLVFTLRGDTYSVTDYTGTVNAVVIPSMYKGVAVTAIGDGAFAGCTGLTSIIIPANVTAIDDSAFSGCTGLTSVTFAADSKLTAIGEYAFCDCTGLTSITIPASVTAIGEYAFSYCTGLTSITIPAGVTSIGNSAFSGCTGLTSVTFATGSKLTTIDDFAFYDCTGLTSIIIPANVTTIGDSAFSCCHKLIEVYNLSTTLTITAGSNGNGYVGRYAKNVYTSTEGESKLSTTLDGYIFYVDGVQRYLMGYTGNSTTLTLPADCNGHSYEIYQYAFYNRAGITAITIPASVTAIGDDAFFSCTGLESIAVESGNTAYHSVGNCLIHTESKTLIRGCKNSVIPTDDSVTAIGDSAFFGCTRLTSITIPAGVTTIGEYAFYGCTGLTSITIPASVTSIGNNAFDRCTGLETVTFAAGGKLTTIGGFAFYNCEGLTSITIPANVTTIGARAFFGCHKLIEVYNLSTTLTITVGDAGNGDVGYYAKNVYTSTEGESKLSATPDGYIFYVDGVQRYLVSYTGNSTTLTLPADCNGHSYEIYQYAFYNRADINSITIPASVTAIGDYAFAGCTGLTSITIPASVTTIGNDAFSGCTGLETVTFAAGSKLTAIGEYAFSGCTGLTSITILASVTTIGDFAFYYCTGLESIAVESGNTVYHSEGNCLIHTESKTLIRGCKNSVIPADNSVTTIGDRAFDYCTGLTSITIPASVTAIGDRAFYCCTGLTSVIFAAGSKLTTIGDYAFGYCWGLTSIIIPANVTTIGEYAFAGCTELTTIQYRGTEAQWSGITKGNRWDYGTGIYTVIYNYTGE